MKFKRCCESAKRKMYEFIWGEDLGSSVELFLNQKTLVPILEALTTRDASRVSWKGEDNPYNRTLKYPLHIALEVIKMIKKGPTWAVPQIRYTRDTALYGHYHSVQCAIHEPDMLDPKKPTPDVVDSARFTWTEKRQPKTGLIGKLLEFNMG